jgi:hypothetical protein
MAGFLIGGVAAIDGLGAADVIAASRHHSTALLSGG